MNWDLLRLLLGRNGIPIDGMLIWDYCFGLIPLCNGKIVEKSWDKSYKWSFSSWEQQLESEDLPRDVEDLN